RHPYFIRRVSCKIRHKGVEKSTVNQIFCSSDSASSSGRRCQTSKRPVRPLPPLSYNRRCWRAIRQSVPPPDLPKSAANASIEVARADFHLETAAKLLKLLERVLAIFSKCALKLLDNQADFDSAIRRFESSRPSQAVRQQ